ncbi:VirB4 family type IV secretion system protein [Staphylococcus haemolyticus]|uniref:VirB4 family type IV secretion system protein n=1 Tax=Staphylococcus haemolyticus TaxID=1283 RepID=UPI0015D84DE9|nr:hypothetical protein [Staphylococcus haemolyticus]MBM6371510.1 hypothetical protein [Staphylococcus epidermidis]HDG8787381.1 hypothetical protein [Staphylococcus aureus]MCG1090277.1 hypothetical protein [Staphylococcus epidermidis]MCH4446446.1 hypothetical protein [Staphylococcus haemolyticus]QXN79067.1 hypothetical protein KVY09_12465 [Staphylococcus haemolyticus]
MASLYEKLKERKKQKNLLEKNENANYEDYDLEFLKEIQTKGGYSYKEDFYVRTGTGYQTCLTIYETPTDVDDFWLGQLMTLDKTIVTIDMRTKDKQEIKSNLSKGITEYIDRMHYDKDAVARGEAQEGFQELSELLTDIRNGGEAIKETVIRIFINGRTTDEVDHQIRDIMNFLNSTDFKGAVYMNEQKYEMKSLTMSLSQQKASLPRVTKDIPSSTIAAGVPFHSVSANDPHGTYYGTSDTKGNIILDLFHKDKRRTSYDGVLVGSKGAGKSHTLKKIVLEEAIQGNRVRTIDSTGEFINLIETLGGKTISLDGTDGMINPFDVHAVAVKERTDDLGKSISEVDEYTSFNQHKQKLSTFYGLMNPDAEVNDKQLFRVLLERFYQEKGLWKTGGKEKITNLPSNQYPTFSEFLVFVQNQLYENKEENRVNPQLSEKRVKQFEAIELTIIDIINSNGQIFDGHTTIENFKEMPIINFSIRQLNSMGDDVKKAQLFNVMNLLFDEMVYFGTPQFQAYNRGDLEFEDAIKYRLIFDEAHNLISASETDAPVVDKCEKFIREDRKYFAGFIFASQDIKDFIPEGAEQKNIAKVKTLFSQTTYRFIMRQDTSNVEKLSQIFSNELSYSELSQIPQLSLGQTILNIAGVRNIKFNIEMTDEENQLFGGGA